MTADCLDLRHRKPLRLTLLLLLCAALLPLAACKKKEEAAAAPAAPTEQAPAAPEPPKEEPPVEFKAAWPVGQRLVQRVETTTDTEFPNPVTQQPIKVAYTLVQELAFTALKARESGGHEVEVETLAVSTTNRSGTNTMVFTSRSDPKQDAKNNFLAGPLRKLVGGKVKLLTTADGKVEKVEGALQLRSKVAAGANSQALFAIGTLLSDDAIKGWNTLHTGLPDKAVKPGDTWPAVRTQTVSSTAVSAEATNTFKGWEQRDGRKVALFESAGILVAKPAVGANAAAATVEDGSQTSGKAWFDPALGVIVESSATSEVTIKTTNAKGQPSSLKAKVVANARLTDAPNPGAATAEAKPAAPAPDTKPADAKPAAKPKAAEKP